MWGACTPPKHFSRKHCSVHTPAPAVILNALCPQEENLAMAQKSLQVNTSNLELMKDFYTTVEVRRPRDQKFVLACQAMHASTSSQSSFLASARRRRSALRGSTTTTLLPGDSGISQGKSRPSRRLPRSKTQPPQRSARSAACHCQPAPHCYIKIPLPGVFSVSVNPAFHRHAPTRSRKDALCHAQGASGPLPHALLQNSCQPFHGADCNPVHYCFRLLMTQTM